MENFLGLNQPSKPIVVVKAGEGEVKPLDAAHKVLAEHNLPYGLLPMESLTDFVYDPNTGNFWCTQGADECDCTFGGYKIKMMKNLSGRLLANMLRDVKGVKVKVAIIWVPCTAVDADPKPGNLIHFWSGPFRASMDAQELWDYKFWAPAFHEELEKAKEVSFVEAAGQLSLMAKKLQEGGPAQSSAADPCEMKDDPPPTLAAGNQQLVAAAATS